MIELAAIIYAVTLLLKRGKYARLTAFNYPYLPADQFDAWRRNELRSIDSFVIIAGIGVMIALCGGFLVGLTSAMQGGKSANLMENPAVWMVTGIEIVMIIIAAIVSSSYQKKALAIRQALGIVPPP